MANAVPHLQLTGRNQFSHKTVPTGAAQSEAERQFAAAWAATAGPTGRVRLASGQLQKLLTLLKRARDGDAAPAATTTDALFLLKKWRYTDSEISHLDVPKERLQEWWKDEVRPAPRPSLARPARPRSPPARPPARSLSAPPRPAPLPRRSSARSGAASRARRRRRSTRPSRRTTRS